MPGVRRALSEDTPDPERTPPPTARFSVPGVGAKRPARLRVGARGELGFDDRSGRWAGGLVDVSYDLGSFAPRAALRGAYRAPADDRSTTARAVAEFWAGIERPFRFGSFVLTPGVAAGVAFARAWRVEPNCSEDGCAAYADDRFSASRGAFRTEGQLAAGLAVGDVWDLSAFLTATWEPFAPGEGPRPAYAAPLDPELARTLALAPPPRVVVRMGLGAAWRGP